MKRVELQSRFDLLQAQSRLDSQAAVATAQLKAAEQMKDHMQAAEAAHLQAMADRLARVIPRFDARGQRGGGCFLKNDTEFPGLPIRIMYARGLASKHFGL